MQLRNVAAFSWQHVTPLPPCCLVNFQGHGDCYGALFGILQLPEEPMNAWIRKRILPWGSVLRWKEAVLPWYIRGNLRQVSTYLAEHLCLLTYFPIFVISNSSFYPLWFFRTSLLLKLQWIMLPSTNKVHRLFHPMYKKYQPTRLVDLQRIGRIVNASSLCFTNGLDQ